jgi:excisionase family DNA binding protein
VSAMLTPAQVAAAWQCSAGHVRKLCRTGALRAMRLGSDWRISEQAVADYEAANTTERSATLCAVATAAATRRPAVSVMPADLDGELPPRWWESDTRKTASAIN